MKFDVPAPPINEVELTVLQEMTRGRLIWLAASTHEGEESLAIEVHRVLSRRFPHLLTLIMPRHDIRGAGIAQQIEKAGFVCAQRSLGQPITKETEIYLVDTMGEMGVFCACAHAVWVGHSWIAPGGGHNPIEPAKLGVPFFYGPYIQNFKEIYGILTAAQATQMVMDPDDLTESLTALFQDPTDFQEMAARALHLVTDLGGATARILYSLEPYVPLQKVYP
jgi:3-deoxy-D-manno-octulosonic-acid transferase